MTIQQSTQPDPVSAVSVRGLRKSFGDKVVLAGIDLTVAEGTVFALLGPNGAGKTTMVHILSTLIPPDAGEASVAGHDVRTDADGVRTTIGVTGQFSAVDDLLTGEENLLLMADLHHLGRSHGRARVAELLGQFDLVADAGRPASTYSGGMRRRLDLAMTLVGSPRVIFLDEPTTGLDPASRHALWEVIRTLVRQGTTVLLTTQYLDEADALAQKIVFLDSGRVVATGTPAELKARAGKTQLVLAVASDRETALLASCLSAYHAVADPGHRNVRVAVPGAGADGLRDLRTVLDAALRSGVALESYTVREPDLDDVYFQLTGHARPADLEDAA